MNQCAINENPGLTGVSFGFCNVLTSALTDVCADSNLYDSADDYKLLAKFNSHELSSEFKRGAKYTDSFQAKGRDSCVIVSAGAERTPHVEWESATFQVSTSWRCCHLLDAVAEEKETINTVQRIHESFVKTVISWYYWYTLKGNFCM